MVKAKSTKSLFEIQNLIWRRILSEAPKMQLHKGTVDSIKSAFRNAGIEPDNILTFREYGGSKEKSLAASREMKKDVFRFLDFSGSLGKITTATNAQGYPTNTGIPRIKSGFLSGSRIQVGRPEIKGAFVDKAFYKPHGISNNTSDGLYTSGSFTYEAFYDWEQGYKDSKESLARLHVTGTASPSSVEAAVINLVASDSEVSLYLRESPTKSAASRLFLTGLNIFDKDVWYVSFGKQNSHDLGTVGTGSYFLRAAKQLGGDIIESYTTSSLVTEIRDSVLKNISTYNASGSFLVIGSQSFQASGGGKFLNDSSLTADASVTNFHGLFANARFFSKNTTEQEFLNRAKITIVTALIIQLSTTILQMLKPAPLKD